MHEQASEGKNVGLDTTISSPWLPGLLGRNFLGGVRGRFFFILALRGRLFKPLERPAEFILTLERPAEGSLPLERPAEGILLDRLARSLSLLVGEWPEWPSVAAVCDDFKRATIWQVGNGR